MGAYINGVYHEHPTEAQIAAEHKRLNERADPLGRYDAERDAMIARTRAEHDRIERAIRYGADVDREPAARVLPFKAPPAQPYRTILDAPGDPAPYIRPERAP